MTFRRLWYTDQNKKALLPDREDVNMAENNGNNNNKNGKNNKNSNLRGVLTLIAWALVLTVAFNYFNAYNHNTANKTTSHEIKYSEMIDMVEKNQEIGRASCRERV